MRALKLLVGVLSLLLLAGFVALVAGLAGLIGKGDDVTQPPAARLDLPAGARVVGMSATADRVVLHVTVPGGADTLYIIDPVSGGLTARLELSATGEAP